ncbi:MAG: lipo-like protein [endosymbiont of Galathealinum brachiosum]|uniref:Lipo-like protein n=1 Tax=endosymbiont of Galathealinum brachiosum TaxID=2200906 RepID=A0A370DIV4_9GAMM|nr:MAG: lipo-like protein [endosymbiont of Galathealinum brachiosum]
MNKITRWLGRYLDTPLSNYKAVSTSSPGLLTSILKPGDVLLVEGDTRISVAIKYLTQSTWSHAAIYVGEGSGDNEAVLIEADIEMGVIIVPLSKYEHLHTRICRPKNLTEEDQKSLIDFLVKRIGYQYDMKNVIDLMRYLLPTPPVPVSWRRRMIALGSGDPTRAICSTLIAQAFQSICYPILPDIEVSNKKDHVQREIMQIRHHSLYTPRDFDISPYFEIIKPSLIKGFNYKEINWAKKSPLI